LAVQLRKEAKEGETYLHYRFTKDGNGSLITHYYEISQKINESDYEDEDLLKMVICGVRQRIQHEKKIEKFSLQNIQILDNITHPIYGELSGLIGGLPSEKIKEMMGDLNLDDNEFDAKVIEILAHYLMRNGVSLKDVLRIVDKPPHEVAAVLENIFKEYNWKEPIPEEKKKTIESFYERILPLIEKAKDRGEILEISRKDLNESGIALEEFLTYLSQERNILFHGTSQKIEEEELKPSWDRSKKVFATDNPTVAIINAFISRFKKREVSFDYPYFPLSKEFPLTIYLKPEDKEIVEREIEEIRKNTKENTGYIMGYIYLLEKLKNF